MTSFAFETLQLLRRETPDFIFPDLWAPNSPDLNPVEIWADAALCLQDENSHHRRAEAAAD